MEIKYGRSYKLSNGEREYIELSMEIMRDYEVKNGFDSLKWKVEEVHNQTEQDLLKEWERAKSFEKHINCQHDDEK